MDYFIISDTHFGHRNIMKFCGRPEGFEEIILANISTLPADCVIIHLGDVAFGQHLYWWTRFTDEVKNRKLWLIRGNHDYKKDSWYLSHGVDMVCDSLCLWKYKTKILFSHKPKAPGKYDLNIHGHLHNNEHRHLDKGLVGKIHEKQYLITMEHDYKPENLRTICESR